MQVKSAVPPDPRAEEATAAQADGAREGSSATGSSGASGAAVAAVATEAPPDPGSVPPAADQTSPGDRDAGAAPGPSRGLNVALAAVSVVALVAFTLYAAYVASRVEDVLPAQAIDVPGRPPDSVFGAGQRAPDFAAADLEGRPVRLSDFAGRPVWINIWASWCAPCRAEMPDIAAVYGEFQARDAQAGRADGLALLMVSIGEDPATVRRYLATAKYQLPVLVDPAFAITERYRITGLPTHYFIARDGTIRELAIGGLKPNGMRARLGRIA